MDSDYGGDIGMKKTIGFRVTGQRIEVAGADILVSGTIDIYTARFTFDSAWDGYTKTAVFAGYDIQREQLLTDDACTVPWEVLTAGKYVKVGVYGTNGGSRLPTIWTDGLLVSPGAGPTEEAAEPSPTLVEQLTAKVGNLDALKTEDKSSVVAAVNEIWTSGGGGSGGGTTDHSKLINRDKADQHPMSAITGLVDALGGKQPVGSYITEESDPTVPEWAKQPQKPAYTAQEVWAIPSSEKGKADGVATLDSSGKVPSGQIPSLEYAGKTHAANHATGSSDPITPSDIGAASKNLVESYLTIPQNTEDPASYLDNLLDEYIATKPNGSLGYVKIQCQVVHPTLGGGQYIASVFVIMQDYVSIEAIAYAAGPANNVVRKYTRSKSNGVWGEWTSVNDLISANTTNKVSVTDIVNDLVTNVANKPLSAAQGVALKALIDAITIPTALPNPNALTFTGAVTGTYDGSAPVNVEIPSGGGSGSSENWRLVNTVTTTEDVSDITITQDSNANALSLKKVKVVGRVRGNSSSLKNWIRITANNHASDFCCEWASGFAATDGQDYYYTNRTDFSVCGNALFVEMNLSSLNNAASKGGLQYSNKNLSWGSHLDGIISITSLKILSSDAAIGAGTEIYVYGVDA